MTAAGNFDFLKDVVKTLLKYY